MVVLCQQACGILPDRPRREQADVQGAGWGRKKVADPTLVFRAAFFQPRRPWFQKNGIGLEYYLLGNAQTLEGCEGLAKTLSVGDDEDVWVELQYYRDRKHAEDAFDKMMKDKSIEPLGKEFFGLITQGKSMVTGGFDRFK